MTRDSLAEINVPISLVEQIGMPVSQAVANLGACIEAIDRQETAEALPAAVEGETDNG